MDSPAHHIHPDDLTLDQLQEVLDSGRPLALSEEARQRIVHCRKFLDDKLARTDRPIYGINTGFGALYSTSISEAHLEQLQHNLVMSHACGTGDRVPNAIVKLMLLLKVKGLSQGHSGISLPVVERLIDLYNNDILPVVYQQGSLGASGDLAPLAHLSLPLIGMGEVEINGAIRSTEEVWNETGREALHLQSKEGLALLNGTQFMSSYAVTCLMHARRLLDWANALAALSIDAYDGRIEPFNHLVHDVRPHPGQQEVAKTVSGWLDGSELISRPKRHVQDPYSFRCVPQVHGATYDMLQYAEQVVVREINSVTDNPTIFPDDDLIVSAGNFHGQPLALVMDSLALALAELGSISERRTYKLIGGQRGLPPFLVADPGLHSGFMIPQYTAASIVSQNKQLATPAVVDTIDSSNGQEDHVSMGANSATKLHRIVENVERILGVELFNATQALEFRRPTQSSPQLERIVTAYRDSVPFVEKDRWLAPDMEASRQFIRDFSLKD